MEITSIPRAPSSLPIINDNGSDTSMTSRATASTSAKYYSKHYSKRGGFQSSTKNGGIGIVCANFGIDETAFLSARGLIQNEAWSEIDDNNNKNGTSLSLNDTARRKKRVDFQHTPSMLLPKKRNNSNVDQTIDDPFLSYVTSLRKGSVVPNDPDRLPIIIAPEYMSKKRNRSIGEISLQRPNSVNSISSLDSDSSLKEEDEVFRSEHDSILNTGEDGEYLDNFAENDISKHRWALLRSKLKKARRKKSTASSTDSDINTISEIREDECPICAKAAKQMGGSDALMTWIVNKFGPRKDVYPKFNSVTRGTIPHFCNFVKKVKLKEKEFDKPHADHTHVHHHSQDDGNSPREVTSNSVHAGSSQSSSTDAGTGGRPSSPASDTGHAETWPQVEEETLSDDSIDVSMIQKRHTPSPVPEVEITEISIPTAPPSPSLIESNDDLINKHDSSKDTKDNENDDMLNKINQSTITETLESVELDEEEKSVSSDLDNNDNKNNEQNKQDDTPDESSKPIVQPPPLPKVNRQPLVPPPPKPEPPRQSPYPHQNVPSQKKPRAPIQKKERKPFERKRSEKTEEQVEEQEVKMEEKEPEPVVVEEVKVPEPPPKPKIEAKVPDLPTVRELSSRKKKGLGSKRGGRESIRFFDDPVNDREPENLNEQRKPFELNIPEMSKDEQGMGKLKPKRRPKTNWLKPEDDVCTLETVKEFVHQEMNNLSKKPKANSWLQGRLALSQQSSRFELPMDMKTLESMTGEEYLKKYCVITQRRHALYQKVHSKYKSRAGTINIKELEKALQEVLVNTITQSDIEHMCTVVGLTSDGVVDYKLFAGLAAMAERMLYPKFVTDDTADLKEFKKETIECADFAALDWKLHGINVNKQVRTILKTL